jgi:hypothetical protein
MAIGTKPKMCQYGNITICAMGAAAGTPTIYSTSGGAFADLTDAPHGEIVLTHKNVVLIFNYYDGANTYNDGWWASDVGDYTVWTPSATVEAANGRFLATPGPVVGACVLGDHVYAFKADSIYRGTYIGYPFFWQWDLVHKGVGMNANAKNAIVSCGDVIAFEAEGFASDNGSAKIYLFDGVSAPFCINEELYLDEAAYRFYYDGEEGTIYIVNPSVVAAEQHFCYAYNKKSRLWGLSSKLYGVADTSAPITVEGDSSAISSHFLGGNNQARSPVCWVFASEGNFKLQTSVTAASASAAMAPYVTSHRYGVMDKKTLWDRVIPLLRDRANISGLANPALSLTVKTYTERHDTTAASTTSVTEDTVRDRFYFAKTDTYAEFKLTFTNIDAEIDDILVREKPAGTD